MKEETQNNVRNNTIRTNVTAARDHAADIINCLIEARRQADETQCFRTRLSGALDRAEKLSRELQAFHEECQLM